MTALPDNPTPHRHETLMQTPQQATAHRTLPLRHASRQRGAAAILLLFLISAVVALAAYSADGTRMTASAAQLKRATDAAALAAAQAYAADANADIQAIAEQYVSTNLGMDSAQTGRQVRVSTATFTHGSNADPAVRVTATFEASAMLKDAGPQAVSVHSAAAALKSALEVALTLPNSGAENERNLAVLRRLGMHFAENLVKDRKEAWLALVPFSQSVNVSPDYTNPSTRAPVGPSANHRQRLNTWAMPSALRPIELTSLFRTGYSGLHDPRIPDRRANLLCMYRGLNRGENYYWDKAPSGQFQIYYRHDLPVNGSPGANPISWRGPNPDIWPDQTVDTRFMVADKGCPSAPLLPLTNDMNKIEERLGQMSTRFNTNYAIAMGWSAMALAPAFRGTSGWNLEDDLPKDFKDDGGNSYKAIVMLVNTTGERWFDSDAYNAYNAQPIDGETGSDGENTSLRTQRFARLCDSFRERKLRFFMIAVGQDEIANNDLGAEGTVDGASEFRRLAGPGLARCAVKSSDITYIQGFDFAAAESRIQDLLDKVLSDIRQQSSYVYLVE